MSLSFGKFWDAADRMVDTFVSRMPALIVAVIVFLLFYGFSFVVGRLIRRAIPQRRQNLGVVFARLVSGATVLVGFLVAFSIIAPSFQASDLIKILGIGGVAIGFAFQNILQNFLAGLLLLWSEPFRVGDEIKLDAFEGTVREIQTRATIIETYDQRQVVIPNADLFTHSVIVNTALPTRRWEYDFAVSDVQDLPALKSRILGAVRAAPGVLSTPPPEAFVVSLDAGTIKIRMLWWTKSSRQHEMLDSYDRVLSAIAEATHPRNKSPRQAA